MDGPGPRSLHAKRAILVKLSPPDIFFFYNDNAIVLFFFAMIKDFVEDVLVICGNDIATPPLQDNNIFERVRAT